MKKTKFLFFLAILGLIISCSDKKPDDPIKIIEQITKEVSDNSDKWEKEEWDAAADKISAALKNLPSPLETKEKIDLTYSLSSLRVHSRLHERRAAKMMEVIKEFEKIIGTSDSDKDTVEEIDPNILPIESDLSGSIDNKHQITMHLSREGDDMITGEYYYNKQGSNNRLTLTGSISDTKIDLEEYNSDNVLTGQFQGQYNNSEFTGTFTTPDGRTMPFTLHLTKGSNKVKDAGPNKTLSEYRDDYDDTESSPRRSASSGSSDYQSSFDDMDEFDDLDERANEYIDNLQKQYKEKQDYYAKMDIDIDQWLDEYLEYMDEFEKYYPGFLKNDPVATSKIVNLLPKHEKFTATATRVGRYFASHAPTPSQNRKWMKACEKALEVYEKIDKIEMPKK